MDFQNLANAKHQRQIKRATRAALSLLSMLAMGCAQSRFVSMEANAGNVPIGESTPLTTAVPAPDPTPTPTPSASPTPSRSPSPTPAPSASPSASPSPAQLPAPGRGPNIKWGCGMEAGSGQSNFELIKDKKITMRLTPNNAGLPSCVKTDGVYQSLDQFNSQSYSELPLSYCGSMADGDYTLTLFDSSGNNLTLTDPLEVVHYVNGNYVISNSNAYADEWYPYLYYGVTSNSVVVNWSDDSFLNGCDSP